MSITKKTLSVLIGVGILTLAFSCSVEPEPPEDPEEFLPPGKVWGTVGDMGLLSLEFDSAASQSKGATAKGKVDGTGTYTDFGTGDTIALEAGFDTETDLMEIAGSGTIGGEDVTISGDLGNDEGVYSGTLTIGDETLPFAENVVEKDAQSYFFQGIFGEGISGYTAPLSEGDFSALIADESYLGGLHLFLHKDEQHTISGNYFTIDETGTISGVYTLGDWDVDFVTDGGAEGEGKVSVVGVIDDFNDQFQGSWQDDGDTGWIHAFCQTETFE